MTYLWAREHLEARALVQDAEEEIASIAARNVITGPDIERAEILAALSEPLGLPGASLPAYGVPGDGCCRECLRPPVHSQGLCVYCGALEPPGMAGQGWRGYGELGKIVLLALILIYGVAALLWAAGVIR